MLGKYERNITSIKAETLKNLLVSSRNLPIMTKILLIVSVFPDITNNMLS